ncbi:MurR/RpiR family transcriptional regulator [Histidinibacterium aquaticum]|uniref:MurR/RpiR family transcriptional regulator n=1 Tax=Histidinibacterium aquaticum TaxID=2613962 RepID=A0A5J5GPP5_9RHOB|nr:MurR/RpiR family transcriptional regulator [Histidinibacterium aquaticum]KAA9010027.1 MurR/RpiR family transcriptional regulator [Histidinibacterium aquaticum]
MSDRSFLSRVRGVLPSLHPAERKLGELVRDFPGELASYSATELAELAGVSNATVTRFVRRLGYSSYDEARRHAREDGASGSRLYLGHVTGEVVREPGTYAEADIRNLRNTLDPIGGGEVDRLARAILDVRKVWVVGFRSANPLAAYLQWQLTQVVENIVAVPGAGQTLGEHLASITQDDLVIVFGLRRRIASFETTVGAVADTGARIAYITDESVTEAEGADWHFRCSTESPGSLFSHVGVMALLNLIANRTIDTAAEAGRLRLNRIETFNERLGEL